MHIGKCFCFVVLLLAAVSSADVAGQSADVEIWIRAPGGQPMRNATVVINRPDMWNPQAKIEPISVVTDEKGIAKFQIPESIYPVIGWTLEVSVAGVGYGTVPQQGYSAGQLYKPDFPPLAPFGSIDGTVPVGLITPGLTIVASRIYSELGGEPPAKTTADAQGHFVLSDLRGGLWGVGAQTDQKHRLAIAEGLLRLAPGQTIRGCALSPPPSLAGGEGPPSIRRASLPGEGQTVTWVQGTVRDESGKSLPNATVYAVSSFFGGLRMYGESSRGIADAQGHYSLQGPGGQEDFSAAVVAYVPGRPPAWAWPSFPASLAGWVDASQPRKIPPPLPPPTLDLVVPDSGARLKVRVAEGGKPLSGAGVAVYLQNVRLRDQWAAAGGGDERELEDIVHPISTTDAQGVAHFDNLLPGRYDIYISADGKKTVRGLFNDSLFRQAIDTPSGMAKGISLTRGQLTEFETAICPHPNRASFCITDPSGAPVHDTVGFSFGPVSQVQWNSSLQLDGGGVGQTNFAAPGLWRIETAYRKPPLQVFPPQPPFFGTVSTVAVAPILENGYRPTFRSYQIQPGSVRIAVKDAAGKPVRVPAEIDRPFNSPVQAGSTDENGEIVFTGLADGFDYIARAFVPGIEPVDLGDGNSPLPADDELKGRTEILADSFVAARNQRSEVLLAPREVGYVRGKVQLPVGAHFEHGPLYVYPDQSMRESGASSHMNPASGEFVAGPFLPGVVLLNVGYGAAATGESHTQISTSVAAGEVKYISASLDDRESSVARATGQALIGVNGATSPTSGIEHLGGRVFLNDGKTPALGAQVFYTEPGQATATGIGLADALGHINWRGMWASMNARAPGTTLGPPEPTVVALLPGQCGGVAVPMSRIQNGNWRVSLPKPVSLRGHVTTAGPDSMADETSIQIEAAYQDMGFLNPLFSISTSADLKGNFVLAGLTPGPYKVQAARDGLWLSQTMDVSVAETDPHPISLAIRAPGGPVLVHLKSPGGMPVVGKPMTLGIPAGPLADELWPTSWTSDGAGTVYIPTLQAGPNSIGIPSSSAVQTVTVPPLPTTRAIDVDLVVAQ
jgi:hypothetical protein